MIYNPSAMLKKYLVSSGSWAFGGRLLMLITSLAINGLLVRVLDPKDVGSYFLIFSIVTVASVLASMGLKQAIVRVVAESLGMRKPVRAQAAIYIGLSYAAVSVILTSAGLALGVGRWLASYVFHSIAVAKLVWLASIWVPMMTFGGLISETFRGLHDIRAATLFGGTLNSLLLVVSLIWLWLRSSTANLNQVLSITIVSTCVSTLFGGLLLHREFTKLGTAKTSEPNYPELSHEIVAIALPLLVTNLAILVFEQATIWIVGAFRPEVEVALYGAASRLVNLISVPLQSVNAVVAPLIASMFTQQKRAELEYVLRACATLAGIPSLLALMCFLLFSGPVLGLLFGDYYRDGAFTLVILSSGKLVNAWAGSCGLLLVMTRHHWSAMTITLLSAVVTVVLALVGVRQFGISGVAFGSAFGLVLQNIVMVIYGLRVTGIRSYMSVSLLVQYIMKWR